MDKHDQKGSITLEAALGLGIFIFAFVMLLSLALYTTIENRTQYAINQTAREISQYYYVLARAGLVSSSDNSGLDGLDDTIDSAFGLANAIGDGYNDTSKLKSQVTAEGEGNLSSDDIDALVTGLPDVAGDVMEIKAQSAAFMTNGQNLFDDPKAVIRALAQSALQSAGTALLSKVIAQPLCQALSKKYFATGEKSADEVLNNWGILNQAGDAPGGMAGLDFGMSTFLLDGRSINVVVVYKVESIIPSVFPHDHYVYQTASTAAWAQGAPLA